MNPDRPFSAYDVVNGYDEDELDRVFSPMARSVGREESRSLS